MATIEALGQRDIIKHQKGTYFDKTFELVTQDLDTDVETDFDTSGYTWSWIIYNKPDGEALFTAVLTTNLVMSSNTYRMKGKIDIAREGKLYFELKGINTSDTNKIYIPHYGDFFNER